MDRFPYIRIHTTEVFAISKSILNQEKMIILCILSIKKIMYIYSFLLHFFFFWQIYQFTENEDNTPAMLLPTIQSICLEARKSLRKKLLFRGKLGLISVQIRKQISFNYRIQFVFVGDEEVVKNIIL